MDFAGLAETSLRLINENGRKVILVRNSAPGTDYDPITGEAPDPANPTEVESIALQQAITAAYATKVGQENIGVRDYLLLMPGSPVVNLEDVIRFDGSTENLQVQRVLTEAPNGLPIIQTVQVRPS